MTTVQVRIINPTLVESTVAFTNPAGVATDPATIIVTWIKPDGTQTAFTYGVDSEVVRTDTGDYKCQLVTDAVGGWSVVWSGENIATGFVNFRVTGSPLS